MNFILTVIGALGVIVAGAAGAWRLSKQVVRRWRNRRALRDFYYRSVDVGYRPVQADRKYLAVRRAEIVALRNDLLAIHLGMRPTGDVNLREWVIPDHFKISNAEAEPHFEEWQRRKLHFDRPLKKKKSVKFTHFIELTVTDKPPQPYFTWCSEHRVDSLQLRVIFSEPWPKKIVFTRRNLEGAVLESQDLEMDPLTYECSKRIPSPEPKCYYSINW